MRAHRVPARPADAVNAWDPDALRVHNLCGRRRVSRASRAPRPREPLGPRREREGREADVSSWYGKRDETCPVSTGGRGEEAHREPALYEAAGREGAERHAHAPELDLRPAAALPRVHSRTNWTRLVAPSRTDWTRLPRVQRNENQLVEPAQRPAGRPTLHCVRGTGLGVRHRGHRPAACAGRRRRRGARERERKRLVEDLADVSS